MSRQSLEARGFRGFAPFSDLTVTDVPTVAGVYVIVRTSATPPTFLSSSPAGHFKGHEPSVSIEELTAAWVDGAEVMYVGKAGAGKDGRRGLRKRLEEYRRYGAGVNRSGTRAGATSGSCKTRAACWWRGFRPALTKIQKTSKPV